jgi:hypothetical protein
MSETSEMTATVNRRNQSEKRKRLKEVDLIQRSISARRGAFFEVRTMRELEERGNHSIHGLPCEN